MDLANEPVQHHVGRTRASLEATGARTARRGRVGFWSRSPPRCRAEGGVRASRLVVGLALTLGLIAAPLFVHGQSATKVRAIGYLGYVEGRTSPFTIAGRRGETSGSPASRPNWSRPKWMSSRRRRRCSGPSSSSDPAPRPRRRIACGGASRLRGANRPVLALLAQPVTSRSWSRLRISATPASAQTSKKGDSRRAAISRPPRVLVCSPVSPARAARRWPITRSL